MNKGTNKPVQTYFRYIVSILMTLSVIPCFLTIVNIREFSFSIFDFLGVTSGIDDMAAEYIEITDFIYGQKIIFMLTAMAVMILPMAASIVVCLADDLTSRVAAALGVIVSNVALIIFYTRMKDMLDYVKSTVVGHLSSDSIITYNLSIVLWVMIYIVIALADLRKKRSMRHSITRSGGVIMKKKRASGENGEQQEVVLIKPRTAYDEARDMIVNSSRRCPSCGAKVGDSDIFCDICGMKIEPDDADEQEAIAEPEVKAPAGAAVCSRCGSPLRAGASFCGKCGERIK